MTATHPRSPLPTRLSTLLRARFQPGPLAVGLRAGLLATGAALLVLALALGMALQPLRSYADGAPEVLRAVHTDALHTTYDGSVLRLSTRIGLGEYREADPANLIFNLEDRASARVELPDLPAFAFLGNPGDPVWIAPESQDPALIWPGWDTETITPGTLAGDAVDLTLLSASGPGNVEIFFNYDEFTGTAQRLFSAADPILRTLHQPVGRHVHANWAFTQLGTYHLTFQATATTTAGTPLTSTPTTYTFVVGPYPPPGTPSSTTTPPGTPNTPPTNPTPTPTGPGNPTPTGPEHPTPTVPGRTTPTPTTPTGPSGPTGPTTPAPTSTRTTTPTPPHPTTTPPHPTKPTPRPTTPPYPTTPAPRPTTPPHPTTTTPRPTTPAPRPTATPTDSSPSTQPSTAPRTSSFGGDEEHATSDSPPNRNNSNPPPGSLPPCPTTPATTNPTTQPNPTTGQTTPPGTTNPPNPTNPSTTAPTSPTNPANPTRTTLDNGHADYAVRLENGALKSRVKDGTKPGTPIWRDPASVTIKLTPASATHAPGGAFDFLGPAGSPLWQIPQTQKDGVIWLGWNTEELTPSQLSTPVDWRLTKVTGPGTLAVFEFDSFGQPKIIFNSRDGLPDTYKIPLGTHAHGNWSFTKPGTYQATFTHSATLTTGHTSTTTSTLTFIVPATPSNASNGAHPAVAHTGATATDNQGSVQAMSAVFGATSPERAVLAAGSPSRGVVEGCRLASTGAEVGPGWVGAGVTLLVIGVVTLVATRRRRGDV